LAVELPEPKAFLGTGRKAIPFSQASTADVGEYAASHAHAVLRLASGLTEELRASEVESVFREIDLPHVPVLARMEQRGVAIDTAALKELDVDPQRRIAEAESDAYAAVGHEFKLGSPLELSAILFDELQLPRTRK